ncbi:MAG: threonine/serine dehydratase [Promethearchaeota archaeon]
MKDKKLNYSNQGTRNVIEVVTLQAIVNARETIKDVVIKTPLIYSQFLSDICQGQVHLKLENQQLTNSFKIRGALNRMTQLTPEERKQGVITASSGNHGQSVALAAEYLQLSAKIVVPMNTSKAKLTKIKKHNVEIALYGDFDEVELRARELAKKEGLIYISPYNDPFIIAGQGTISLELFEDLNKFDMVIVPIGGGGLISGISIAIKSINPNVQIIGVQPEIAPTMYESIKAGKIIEVEEKATLADGILGGLENGAITFKIIQNHVDKLCIVREESVEKAINVLWNEEQQVIEGAGALAIAYILENKQKFKGKTVVAVISGGNIEESLFRQILEKFKV